MKKVLIFTAGSLVELIANNYGLSRYFWYSVVATIAIIIIYRQTKETRLVRFIRMKKKLLDLWLYHVMLSPKFFALLFLITSLFALVDRDNKHIFPFIDEVQTWWMTTLVVISTIIWLPNLFAICISAGFYDEFEEEESYRQNREKILNWYTNKPN